MKLNFTQEKLKKIGILTSEERRNTVLLLAGTGLNFWIYYPILKNFSIAELNEFEAVYTISGGSIMTWVYSLSHQEGGFRRHLIDHFDNLFRSHMNEGSVGRRVFKLFKGKSIYSSAKLRRFMTSFVSPRGAQQSFREFDMQNLHIVGHDIAGGTYRVFSRETTPDENVASVVASVVTPQKLLNRPFTRAMKGYESLSDFDFAPSHVRSRFFKDLHERYPDKRIVVLNIMKNEVKGKFELVRIPAQKFPRIAQIQDLARVFFDISNPAMGREFRLGNQK
jgi:hypothetical protein